MSASAQACRKRGGADGGTLAPQFLAKQLTLSQPGGQATRPPPAGFSDLATALLRIICVNGTQWGQSQFEV